jgi:anti-sigma factor RsiW
MFCDEALDLVESIADGELTPEGRVAAHLATCPNCAAALASARRLEGALRARPAPRAPARFTSKTMALLRRRRWRSEQFVDVGFNIALAAVALLVVAGAVVLLNRAGVTSIGSGALDAMTGGIIRLARRAAPAVPVYAGATALLAAALGVWWWAERDTGL